MIQLQQNRYLWVHFAALALVPLLLDFCLVGLASARSAFGYPTAYGFQFWLVALVCVGPPLWMQIVRPFYVFSLPPLALRPDVLTEDQRRCLTVLTSWQMKALAGVSAVVLIWLLAQLYEQSVVVAKQSMAVMTPTAGMVSAVVAFFFACLFVQISVSAGRSLLVSPTALKRVPPYEGAIAQNFLIAGFRIKKLLPQPSPIPVSSSPGESSELVEPEALSELEELGESDELGQPAPTPSPVDSIPSVEADETAEADEADEVDEITDQTSTGLMASESEEFDKVSAAHPLNNINSQLNDTESTLSDRDSNNKVKNGGE